MKRCANAAVVALALLFVLPPAFAGPADRPTVTFFVASDSHFGANGMLEANRALVEQMNALPGTDYPPEVGGKVESPRGVLVTGDLTDNGSLEEFAEFEQVYGLTGKDGLLAYPVFEAIGNHDVNADSPIKERARLRHGGINYAWDWADLHLVCLDMYPDSVTREWLAKHLEGIAAERPLILFFHYSLEGWYSRFWSQEDKDAFAEAILGRNVVAIFHGHEHRAGHYQWRGQQVFKPGSPKHSSHAFLAVRVRANDLAVASWDFDNRKWLESWIVAIRR